MPTRRLNLAEGIPPPASMGVAAFWTPSPVGSPATVAVIDDYALTRDGLVHLCASHPSVTVIHAGDDFDALAKVDPPPMIVVVDLGLDDRRASRRDLETIIERGGRMIVVGAFDQPDAVRATLQAQVAGIVSKHESTTELHAAIDAVIAGGVWTTPRLFADLARERGRPRLSEQEQRALVLYASGLKIQSVARQLGVKPSTVREYIARVRAKYAAVGRQAPTKVHLHNVAREDGLLDEYPPPPPARPDISTSWQLVDILVT